MAISCIQAGKKLCELSSESLTQLRMQKILYYAHMIHLGRTSTPLTKNKFLAWKYGPVALGLYDYVKNCGAKEVALSDFEGIEDLDGDKYPEEIKSLKKAYEKLKDFSAGRLIAETHVKNGAWDRTIGMGKVEMFNDLIQDEYRDCPIIK